MSVSLCAPVLLRPVDVPIVRLRPDGPNELVCRKAIDLRFGVTRRHGRKFTTVTFHHRKGGRPTTLICVRGNTDYYAALALGLDMYVTVFRNDNRYVENIVENMPGWPSLN
jgi:hypothetical protein